MTEWKNVSLKTEANVATIDLHKAPSNILDFEFMSEISCALDQALSAPFLVLSSDLNHFSLGVDIKIHTPDLVPKMLQEFHSIIGKLYHFPGISFCLLQGYALGGGLELALPCDYIFAETNAKLGFPEIRLACFPPVAAVLLPRMATHDAVEMLFAGETISSQRAKELGFVHSVFDQPDRDSFLAESLKRISAYSFDALKTLKKLLRTSNHFDFDHSLEEAEKLYMELLKSPDVAEGIEAFLQKRSPKYKNH